MSELVGPVLAWYETNARDLPWRRPSASPWAVMVSEFMLQQTPVARVLDTYEQWLRTWPTPASLAADSPGAAVRAWGRLGYPRRALRLHDAARAIVMDHGGEVPSSLEALRRLPGVGDYTAAAVASFAFGQRHPVLDTNVRRVLARTVSGRQFPPASVRASERVLAATLLPDAPAEAAAWAVASMELGALVCTARSPRCGACPVADRCSWRRAGFPEYDGPPRRKQTYADSDRECRGRLLAVVREAEGAVPRSTLTAVWADATQRERCLTGLVTDGLVTAHPDNTFALP